ncbi:Delta-like protein 3 [Holothuria leucospilota]|uniref:Delta-like protein 3 n=1 Tax=Holothuria leucospilota TaxID=206669 RepID=A0A9Q1H2W9_HOLLE|nr:Delta-like protein 3 [Holothuria leucospilota]
MKTSTSFYFDCIVFLLLYTVGNVAGQVCSPSPCMNGGSCFETFSVETGFLCMCSSNFTGDTCETALPGGPVMCGFNTCGNGGTCSITSGAIECTCTTGYTGPRCDTPVNIIASTAGSSQALTTKTAATSQTIRQTTSNSISDPTLPGGPVMCRFNTCGNGGTCSITSGAIECTCTTDFTGPRCDTPVNIIASTGSSQALTTKTAATSQTIRQMTSSSISDPSEGSVPTWVIIIVTVAAVIVFVLVLILFAMITTRKRKGKNESGNPHMISDFTRNTPEGDSANMGNGCTAETNLAYDPHSFDAYDDPPPDYDDDRSINGFLAPAPRIYDNKELSLDRRDPCPTNDYGDFSRSDDDGFDAALY